MSFIIFYGKLKQNIENEKKEEKKKMTSRCQVSVKGILATASNTRKMAIDW